MTNKEREYLLDWVFNELDTANNKYLEKLYCFEKYHTDIFLDDLMKSFHEYKFYSKFFKNFIDVLKTEMFDDTTKYKNRSAELLNRVSLTKNQDDLIYSFVLGIIHSNRLSNFDKNI